MPKKIREKETKMRKKNFLILILSIILALSLTISSCTTDDTSHDKKTVTVEAKKCQPFETTPKNFLDITRITPDGKDVPAQNQIVIQFNRPVVPLGRMDRKAEELPIKITPQLNCEWRWLNTSALSCQLKHEDSLKQSTRYTVNIQPGIYTEECVTTIEEKTHEFITQRPKINYVNFNTWKSPGTPVIRATFNQSVSKKSVEEHLFIKVMGSDIRYALTAEPDPHDRRKPDIIPIPGEGLLLITGNQKKDKSDDDPKKSNGIEARRVWLLTPKKELPLDTGAALQVEPGLVSALGPEKGITERVVVQFDTFPEFKFIGLRCYTNDDKRILFNPDNVSTLSQKCNPLNNISLSFSAPVIHEEIKEKVVFLPDLAGGRDDYDPWENMYKYSRLGSPHKKGREYEVYLPEVLKAWQEYEIKSPKEQIKDEFGRSLDEPIDIHFNTDHRKPDYELSYKTSVLEKHIDSEVPIVVTNLKKVTVNYKTLTIDGARSGLTLENSVPQVEDIAFKMPLRIRSALKGKSGALFGSLSADPQLKKNRYEREFFAQVTPFQVHVKAGHFNTLVWVTDLETGKGVEEAKINIYKDSVKSLSHENDVLSRGVTDSHGIAILDGTEKLDPNMRTFGWGTDFNDTRFFVHVHKNKDIAVLPLDEWFLVDTYQASNHTLFSSTRERYGHIHAWGTTAQGVYRAGDTIQYKLFVRNQDNKSFVAPPKGTYRLEIIDPTGKLAHEKDKIKLSEFGAHHGEFTVPKTGAVGWYQFVLRSDFTKSYTWRPMRVLVSDFTPASFRVKTDVNGDVFHQDDTVEVSTTATLHSGGPYVDASARIVARLKGKYFSSKHPVAKSFVFDSYRYQERPSYTIFNKTERINDKGELKTKFEVPDKGILYGRLIIESAVKDDRGKYIADSTTVDYVGRNRFVGLKNTKWMFKEDEAAHIKFIVVDETGEPRAGSDVQMKVERLVTKASRVKGAGNAYLTKYIEEWVQLSTFKFRSQNTPGTCEFIPPDPGTLRITASIKDTKGREHRTTISAWVAGKGRVIWHQPDDNSIEIIPEQETYKIGDTARYLIKNPFPGATALISIERYGVMKHWTQTLNTSTPVIEFPVKPEYMPGFYFSIVVMSPRVDKPLGEGDVDLGKPTFRMGYVSVPVKDPYKEIVVDVKTEKKVYKPRDKVIASVKAKPKNADKEGPIELAVVVIDEAVFDLLAKGRNYYDPYNGFYYVDGLDLQNYSLLTRLVGRQKFEKKGANAGGGGGPDIDMRSIFKFVSYWNPSLRLDKNGEAEFAFEVPDNLTGWRIFVMAVTPTDRMGLGETEFKVNKPTEIRPVMPNQVIEGDEFKAGFSVMNRTDKVRKISVNIKASGPIDKKQPQATYKKTIKLSPYKRTSVWMPIQTKKDGKLTFEITAGDTIDSDGLIHEVPVNRRRSLDTAANYGTTTKEEVTETIVFPKNIHTDVGNVSVVISPTIIGNVDGAFRYIKDYPYICWEQKLSKGVMASHYVNLREYLPKEFSWKEGRRLAQETLDEAVNYQATNGGMAYYKPTNRYVSPYLSAYTAIAFTWLGHSGYKIPVKVEKKLLEYLYSLMKRDVFPSFYSKGMSSSVRAVALAALSNHGRIELADLERYRSHVSMMDLFGKAHYLHAALNVEGGQSIALDVAKQILAHSSQTGGKFFFNETLDDSYKRILATPVRANGAILSSFIKLAKTKVGATLVGDVPFKLVRSITQIRGNRDHWENTQENVFCMNALIDYSRVYENKAPKMTIQSFMDETLMGEATFKDVRDDPVTFEIPITKKDPGRKAKGKIKKQGQGRFYYATRIRFAPLEEHDTRTNAGIEIRREYSVERNGKWKLMKSPMKIKRGELVRVDIYLSLPTVRNFVVVDDPVPGGLEPVNRNLATSSDVDADKGDYKASGGSWWFQFSDWIYYNAVRWSFYHQELRHDSVRYYSDYLPAGNYHLSYTAQAIAAGEFIEMPVHAEEMYDPDVYGKGITGKLIVSD
jgi:uncharacterized protein YfaS (alpha-2-macroglobulin family)